MTGYPRYTFDHYAASYPNRTYAVSAVTDRGWSITWYVEYEEDGSLRRIWRSKPSNETLLIKPTGSLGRRILSIVNSTIAQRQAVGCV